MGEADSSTALPDDNAAVVIAYVAPGRREEEHSPAEVADEMIEAKEDIHAGTTIAAVDDVAATEPASVCKGSEESFAPPTDPEPATSQAAPTEPITPAPESDVKVTPAPNTLSSSNLMASSKDAPLSEPTPNVVSLDQTKSTGGSTGSARDEASAAVSGAAVHAVIEEVNENVKDSAVTTSTKQVADIE